MKLIRRLTLWIAALTLLCIASSGEISALVVSNSRQTTFEELTTQAKVIVRGRVTEIPEMAVYDRASHHVYRRNVVHVEEYLKGTGLTPNIEVVTFGGNFDTDGLGLKGPRFQFVLYGGAEPQMPPVGTEVLLFLNSFSSGQAFTICCSNNGIIRIQEAEKDQEPYVSFVFSNPDLVSPAAAARARAMNHEAPDGSGSIVIFDRVAVSALKTLVDRVLNLKRKPTTAGGVADHGHQ